MSEVVEQEVLQEEMQEQFEFDGFSIEDDRKAEYAFKRMQETQAEVDAFRAYYAEQIDGMQKRADAIKEFYMGHLQRYFSHVPHKKTNTQESYKCPSFTMTLKAQNPEYKRDAEKVLEWCGKSDDTKAFVKNKPVLDWEGLKKRVVVVGSECFMDDTGEKIPGVEVVEREPKFEVKPVKKTEEKEG